ncbi:hypothetical protein BAE44_0018841, partial [Dichanthelium oligosanthes]
LKLAAEWSPNQAILESDCLPVSKYLTRKKQCKSPSYFIIQESLEIIKSLPRVVLCHIKREQNTVAHELAQLARRLCHSAVWCERSPSCVDCNSSIE